MFMLRRFSTCFPPVVFAFRARCFSHAAFTMHRASRARRNSKKAEHIRVKGHDLHSAFGRAPTLLQELRLPRE